MPQDPFYNSPQWRAMRAAKRAANPVCKIPGCGRHASYVDHIKNIRSGGAPFALANLMSLDHGCHSRKTVRVDSGFGRASSTAQRGCDANGIPLDPGHRWRSIKPAP